MIRGYDLSSAQSDVAWDKVSPDIAFVLIKHGNGNDSPDSMRDRHWDAAQGSGRKCLPYHLIFPLGHIDPVACAEAHFALRGIRCTHAVDFEWPTRKDWTKYRPDGSLWWKVDGKSMRDWTIPYGSRLAGLSGKRPLLYTFPDFWWPQDGVAGNLDSRFLSVFDLWAADYRAQGRVPADGESPRPWPPWAGWTVWQHSGDRIGNGPALTLPGGAVVDGDVVPDQATLDELVREVA